MTHARGQILGDCERDSGWGGGVGRCMVTHISTV